MTGQLKIVGVAYDLAAPPPVDSASSTDSEQLDESLRSRADQIVADRPGSNKVLLIDDI